jgi:membrane-associated phospholipid phosphatase
MALWTFKQWPPANQNNCRRQLILALDFIAACMIAQVFLDHRLAALVREFQSSPVVRALSLIPDRVQLSLLFTAGMMLLLAYRVTTGDRLRTDRGMFILGCGVVAGFIAARLKIIFGRPPPEALLNEGAFGFHFFNGGIGFDSFPSSHAAIAAGIAGALSAIWPAHRRLFLGLAAIVAASRFVIGAHYLSDVLLGCAVGLGIVVLMQMLFSQCGIYLGSQGSSDQRSE